MACNYFSAQRARTGQHGVHTRSKTPALVTYHRNENRVLVVGGRVARGRDGVERPKDSSYQLGPPALLPGQSPPSESMSMLLQLVPRPIDRRDS